MHEFETIPIANMVFTRSQNYTNMVVGKHGIQRFEVVVIVLLVFLLHLMFLSPPLHIPYYFWTSGLSKYIHVLEFGVAPRTYPKKPCAKKRLDNKLKIDNQSRLNGQHNLRGGGASKTI